MCMRTSPTSSRKQWTTAVASHSKKQSHLGALRKGGRSPGVRWTRDGQGARSPCPSAMNRRHFFHATAAAALTALASAAGPQAVDWEQVAAKRAQLEREIATLKARMSAALPEFEVERQAWESRVLQDPGSEGTKEPKLPPRIQAILALEPSEREPAQREEVVAYFRPLSKTLGAICQQLAARRAALAALPGPRRGRGSAG